MAPYTVVLDFTFHCIISTKARSGQKCSITAIFGLQLHNPRILFYQLKSVYMALQEMNSFPPYNRFPHVQNVTSLSVCRSQQKPSFYTACGLVLQNYEKLSHYLKKRIRKQASINIEKNNNSFDTCEIYFSGKILRERFYKYHPKLVLAI